MFLCTCMCKLFWKASSQDFWQTFRMDVPLFPPCLSVPVLPFLAVSWTTLEQLSLFLATLRVPAVWRRYNVFWVHWPKSEVITTPLNFFFSHLFFFFLFLSSKLFSAQITIYVIIVAQWVMWHGESTENTCLEIHPKVSIYVAENRIIPGFIQEFLVVEEVCGALPQRHA